MNLVDQINIINNTPVEAEPSEPVPPRIKGLIITEVNDSGSMYAARRCGISIEKTKSEIDYTWFPATLPSTVARDLKKITYLENPELLPWTWPTKKEDECIDFKTGLYKSFDPKADQSKLISNAVSHMRAWQYCIDVNQPVIIMNHDTVWTRKYIHENLDRENTYLTKEDTRPPKNAIFKGGIVTLRNAASQGKEFKGIGKYNQMVDLRPRGLSSIISVDFVGYNRDNYPQHIIDEGTYLITPWAAKKLLDQIQYNGMWPVNVLMNIQLFP